MEIHIDGDRGKVSLSFAEDGKIEIGFLYEDEEYYMQVDQKILRKVLYILEDNSNG